MIQAFIEDADLLMEQLKPSYEGEEFACFLTEPHPVDEEARKKVCLDVIEKYCKEYDGIFETDISSQQVSSFVSLKIKDQGYGRIYKFIFTFWTDVLNCFTT